MPVEQHKNDGGQMKVQCPNCEWGTEVPDEKIPAGGGQGTCPKCKNKFFVRREVETVIESTNINKKPCPLCGEEIITVAKKCKHCKSILNEVIEEPLSPVKELNQAAKPTEAKIIDPPLPATPLIRKLLSKKTVIAMGTVCLVAYSAASRPPITI